MSEPEHNERIDERDLQAPDSLVRALGDLQRERVFIPPDVDNAVLNRTRPHLAGIRQRSSRWDTTRRFAAMAAAFVLVIWIARTFSDRNEFQARGDVNRDGSVNILDAFQVAREVKSGKTTGNDFNDDGKVDATDVEMLARQAVALDRQGAL